MPFEADPPRTTPTTPYWINGVSASYMVVNRNKRGLPAEREDARGRGDRAHRLFETADVVVENYRPGVLDRLGVGYEDARTINPGIVYAGGERASGARAHTADDRDTT